MIDRFVEILRPSAAKELHRFLKNADPSQMWEYWCSFLENRAGELGIELYAEKVARFCPGEFEALHGACDLILRPNSWTDGQWVDRLEELLEGVEKAEDSHPLNRQLLAELGFLLGSFFPMLKATKSTLEKAREIFAEELEERLDGAGLPKSEHLPFLRPMIASWSRVLFLKSRSQVIPWKSKSQQQYEWAVLQSLRFSRKDFSAVFSPIMLESHDIPQIVPEKPSRNENRRKKESPGETYREMIREALQFDSDPLDEEVFRILTSGRKTGSIRKNEEQSQKKLPDATYFSPWSRVFSLRSGWSHEEPHFAVMYGDSPPWNRAAHRSWASYELPLEPNNPLPMGADRERNSRSSLLVEQSESKSEPFGGWSDSRVFVELNFKSQTVLSGVWNFSVLRNGKPLYCEEQWVPLCSLCESEYDYLELENDLSEDFRVQRHILLLHDEEILLLADSILPRKTENSGKSRSGADSGWLQYESRIPLTPFVQGQSGEPGASERVLFSRTTSRETPIARVLPLALPEWTGEKQQGELVLEDSSLVLREHGNGSGLFAPMLFDLDTSRMRYPYTWRNLSVGEKLEKVAPDRAVGFRIQLHKDQFLLYRSLTAAANRTVLGHNLISDLFFGRFTKTDGVQTLLELEED